MRVPRAGWPIAASLAVVLGTAGLPHARQPAAPAAPGSPPPLRLHGLVEPVRSHAVTAPRLAAAQPGAGNQLIIVRLAPSGTVVRKGDLLVEFDRHGQLKVAHDREAEYRDFVEQIRRTAAEQRIARARRLTELVQAENALKSAELDMLGIELVPKIQAEKDQQALEEARAHLAALRRTQALKDTVEAAELRKLELQRDRAQSAWRHATANAERMLIVSPIDGLVVLKAIWKSGTMAVVQEGEEVRAGIPLLDVVDPSGMRVRALVNQADVGRLGVGQPAAVTLDSYPARTFDARLDQLSPVAMTSGLNPRVRNFVALFSIAGSDPQLLPDLAAAVDVAPAEGRP
jgi:HlyD family secretion protein